MPGTLFPPARSHSWSRRPPSDKPLNCNDAVSPKEGIFPLGRRSRSNNESAAHEQYIAKPME